jgi:hypothetical protein
MDLKTILQIGDPYLIIANSIKPRVGFTIIDEAKTILRKTIGRYFETRPDQEERKYRRNPLIIPNVGAAAGIDESGLLMHFWAGYGLRFIGFIISIGDDLVAVRTRGSVFLTLPGAKPGQTVFCLGSNCFSLTPAPGAVEIGRVRFVEGKSRAAVAFKSEGDSRPLDLDCLR